MFVMRKFVIIYHGDNTATPELVAAWNDWIRRRAASVADIGNRFGAGRRITNERTVELSLSAKRASGYSIVDADHIDAAEQLLEGCPIVDSISLYEAMPNNARRMMRDRQRSTP